MSTKEKVQCPICSGHFAKLAITTHVNRCLNALEEGDEDDVVEESCQDSRSPPRKQSKLEDGSRHYKAASDVTRSQNKKRKQPDQSGAISPDTLATTSSDPIELDSSPKTESNLPNAFTVMTRNCRNTKNAKESPKATRSGSQNLTSPANKLAAKSRKPSATVSKSPDDKFDDSDSDVMEDFFRNESIKEPELLKETKKETQVEVKKPNAAIFKPKPAAPSLPQSTKIQDTNNNKRAQAKNAHQPLAERMRPLRLEDYMGQEHILGRGKMVRDLLMAHTVPSMIFWGPPGCGKTTLARIVAARCKETHDTRFVSLSATTAGVADVKDVVKVAKNELRMMKRKTILFVDEIHRFNKLQQDTFLPHIEDGTIILLGATTENPSFHVNNALLSRCKLLTLEKLSVSHIEKIITKAIQELGAVVAVEDTDNSSDEENDEECLSVDPAAIKFLASHCDGDARTGLNTLQATVDARNSHLGHGRNSNSEGNGRITVEDIKDGLQRSHIQYDKTGEEHYNCASALQKSIRGSDDSGAIYWMTRMLEGGEDPMFIARRLVVCASEDIGLADPRALPLAVAAQQACHLIGKPECAINLAHCVTYLARAPKSNESYQALSRARESIRNYEGSLPGVPLHLRNAPTKLMKNLGYGVGYKYSHNYPGSDGQEYLPAELKGVNFFQDQ